MNSGVLTMWGCKIKCIMSEVHTQRVRNDSKKAVIPEADGVAGEENEGTSAKLGDGSGYRYLMKAVVCDSAREACG
jgi:hypothetical protein